MTEEPLYTVEDRTLSSGEMVEVLNAAFRAGVASSQQVVPFPADVESGSMWWVWYESKWQHMRVSRHGDVFEVSTGWSGLKQYFVGLPAVRIVPPPKPEEVNQ